jgi:hypothetical protein
VLLAVLVAYGGSYWYFTRQWVNVESGFAGQAVLYTSDDGDLTRADWMQHSVLSVVFAPLNWLDHQVLGSPRPPRCILFELS